MAGKSLEGWEAGLRVRAPLRHWLKALFSHHQLQRGLQELLHLKAGEHRVCSDTLG